MKQKSSVSLYWRRSSNKNFLSLLIFTVSALLCKFKVKMAYKLYFKCCCCFRCFSFRNCRSCTAKTIQLANELPEFREFHFNFLRGRCESNGITSRMPSSALHRVAIKSPYIFCDKDLPADRGLLYHTFRINPFTARVFDGVL